MNSKLSASLASSASLTLTATRFLSCVAFISCVGCARAAEPPTQAESSAMKEKTAPAQLAQAETPAATTAKESAAKDSTEQDTTAGATSEEFRVTGDTEARRLAEQHVALKQYGWGRPTSVSEHSGQYIVTFDTPERERVLIGNRAVIVDRKSAVVSVQKRR